MGKNNDLLTTTIEYGVVTNNKTSEGGNIMKRNRSLFLLATLVVILLVTFTGCKKNPEPVVPQTSEEPVVSSEEVSETPSSEEVTEPASEEVSEVASEEVSEEPVVEEVNFSNATELFNYLKNTNETKVTEFSFSQEGSSQMVIPNGSKYTMKFGFLLYIVSNKEISEVITNAEYIETKSGREPGTWGVYIKTTGTDLEVPLTIKYADGTEEEILLYVTNTFE